MCIGKNITHYSKIRLEKGDGRMNAKNMCAVVQQLTGRQQETGAVTGITAESLNSHYAAFPTDSNYMPSLSKQLATTVNLITSQHLSISRPPPSHRYRARPTSGLVP